MDQPDSEIFNGKSSTVDALVDEVVLVPEVVAPSPEAPDVEAPVLTTEELPPAASLALLELAKATAATMTTMARTTTARRTSTLTGGFFSATPASAGGTGVEASTTRGPAAATCPPGPRSAAAMASALW